MTPLPTSTRLPGAGPERGSNGQRFRTILCDPPWSFRLWGKDVGGRSPASHYPVQGADYLLSLPVAEVCERDCALLLWVVNSHLPEALRLVEAWGFTYSTKLTWGKVSGRGAKRIGLGYRARSCCEDLWLCFRGEVAAPAPADRPHGLILSPVGEHSRKPDWQYEIAEGYEPPYLEMFCRPREEGLIDWRRPNWTYTGNEVDSLDMAEALHQLAAGTEEGSRR